MFRQMFSDRIWSQMQLPLNDFILPLLINKPWAFLLRLNNLSFFDFLWNAWTWIATCVWFFFLAVNVMITWFVLKLQYLSQILKHLCDFPLPQCWFGYYSHLSAPKYAWLNIGEGEGHICERTKVSGVKFGENSRQMAPVSMICDEYCI